MAERFLRHRAVAARLQERGPIAVLLDDLHWADEASVELVLHLLRRPVAVPALLVIAARPVGPAARLLDAARCAPGWEQLELEPLAHEDALALVAGVADPEVRERVVREGRGNPLFLSELARVADRGDGALPPTLVAAVSFEVAALAHEARALIQGAAVAGEPFDPELAAAIAGLDPASAPRALDALVAADLVRPARGDASSPASAAAAHSDEVRSRVVAEWTMSPCGAPLDPNLVPPAAAGRAFVFRHPLVRRAVYDACAPGWRLGAHERAAAALEARGAGPAARAYHVVRSAHAGDADAIAVLSAAAEVAGQSSPAAAAHWYGAALRLVPDRDRDARAGLLARHALALGGSGRLPEARTALLEALALAPQLRAHDRVRADRDPARDAHRRPPAAARRAGRRAALPARGAGLRAGRGRLPRGPRRRAARLGGARRAGGAGGPAAAGRRARRCSRSARSGAAIPQTAAAALDRASSGLDALDDATLASHPAVPVYVGIAQFLHERFAAATGDERPRAGDRAPHRPGPARRDADRAAGDLAHVPARARRRAARGRGGRGGRAAAGRPAPAALRALDPRARPRRARGGDRGRARRARGHRADGEPGAEQAHPHGRVRVRRRSTTSRCGRSARWPPAAGPLLELADPTHRTWLLLRLVRAAIAAGDLDLAEQWAEDAVAHAERLQLAAGSVRAAVACAEVVLARGDAAEAAVVAEHACEAADTELAPLDALQARLVAGRALAAAGDAARPRRPAARRRRRRAAPAPRACTRPRGASCAGSARASPLPPAAPRGGTRP